jgi:hypothetical protein
METMTLQLDNEPQKEIIEFAPDGFDFGEGPVGVAQRLEGENPSLTREAIDTGKEIILSGRHIKKVEADDDGCGDGRPTRTVYQLIDGVKKVFTTSLLRAKVFGGGLTVAASMYRVTITKDIQDNPPTLLEDRQFIAHKLREENISYGGHCDTHAEGEACGCGAIDKSPLIAENVLKYKPAIDALLWHLLGEEEYATRQENVADVFDSYQDQVDNASTYFSNASGAKTLQFMEREGSIIKELEGDHQEVFIVINDVEGTSFDQEAFRVEMKERGIKEEVQVFIVDLWRGRQYAHFMAKMAHDTYDMDYDQAYKKAETDFLIRTFSVAATLTKGDLPVFFSKAQ